MLQITKVHSTRISLELSMYNLMNFDKHQNFFKKSAKFSEQIIKLYLEMLRAVKNNNQKIKMTKPNERSN